MSLRLHCERQTISACNAGGSDPRDILGGQTDGTANELTEVPRNDLREKSKDNADVQYDTDYPIVARDSYP